MTDVRTTVSDVDSESLRNAYLFVLAVGFMVGASRQKPTLLYRA